MHKPDMIPNASYATDKGLTLVGDGAHDDTAAIQRQIDNVASLALQRAIQRPTHPLASTGSLRDDVAGYKDAHLPEFSSSLKPSGSNDGR